MSWAGGTSFSQLPAKEREIWPTRKSPLSMHCRFLSIIASTLKTMLRRWKTTPDSIANWDDLTLLRPCGERLFICAKGLETIREPRYPSHAWRNSLSPEIESAKRTSTCKRHLTRRRPRPILLTMIRLYSLKPRDG